MSRDPIGEDGGVAVYSFCLNNGVYLVDPLGRKYSGTPHDPDGDPDSDWPWPFNGVAPPTRTTTIGASSCGQDEMLVKVREDRQEERCTVDYLVTYVSADRLADIYIFKSCVPCTAKLGPVTNIFKDSETYTISRPPPGFSADARCYLRTEVIEYPWL